MRRVSRWGIALVVAAAALGGAAQAQTPAPKPPDAPTAAKTGQRISLDLKGVDILDVLKLLSQKSGLNFIAGRNVTGRVTIFVNNVDVWQAFELIIGANDLAYERRDDIVTVMMARDYELIYGQKFQERTESAVIPLKHAKAIQVATVLNQIKSSVGRVVADEATNTLVVTDVPSEMTEMRGVLTQLDRPTESRVYILNYAEAEKLKEKVQELLSPIGTFTFDARTNKAVVSDLSEVLAKVDRVVKAFDTPDPQVLIEAKILKVVLSDEMSLGVDWQRVFAGIDSQVRVNLDSLSGDVFATSSAAIGGALKMVGSTRGSGAQVIIEALNELTRTETLSNPRIMVGNNQEARILVGTKEAFITVTTTVPATGSTVNAPQVQFVDVGTKLLVTPSIKADGRVQLKIHPEVSSADETVTTSDGNRIPIVTSTEAETTVLVQSGSTLILGGLIETSLSKTDNRIPWLGDLPVIGRAFRGTTDDNDKTELVLLLTPQIVTPDGKPVEFAAIPAEEAKADPTIVLQAPVPAAYRRAVREQLQRLLADQFRATGLGKGSVTVSFVLNPQGQFVGDPQVSSPEGSAFTDAATQALSAAGQFPPFPDGSSSGEVRFRMAVDYLP